MSTTPHLPDPKVKHDPDEVPSTRRVLLQFLAIVLALALVITWFVRLVASRALNVYGNQPWVKSGLVVPHVEEPGTIVAANGTSATVRGWAAY